LAFVVSDDAPPAAGLDSRADQVNPPPGLDGSDQFSHQRLSRVVDGAALLGMGGVAPLIDHFKDEAWSAAACCFWHYKGSESGGFCPSPVPLTGECPNVFSLVVDFRSPSLPKKSRFSCYRARLPEGPLLPSTEAQSALDLFRVAFALMVVGAVCDHGCCGKHPLFLPSFSWGGFLTVDGALASLVLTHLE